MNNSWFFDLDGGSVYNFPIDPLVSNGFRGHLLSRFASFADSSLYQSNYFHVPGSLALQEAFSCISKFAGTLIFLLSSSSNLKTFRNLSENPYGSKRRSCRHCTLIKQIGKICVSFRSNGMFVPPELFGKISKFTMRQLGREAQRLQSIPVLSLAAALIPPLDNISRGTFAVPLESADIKIQGCMDQRPCEVGHRAHVDLSFLDLKWSKHAVEPRTGIEFPAILDNILAGEDNSTLTSEVLVGTGSRIMTIIKLKSLKVYAFGFYVHPYSVCTKLDPKYAYIPVGELNKCGDFYKDLLREDISMTVRLVININGVKINTVKDAFEKSLRARLLKTNPDTDYECLRTFDSYFNQDIPLPAGTTVDFRRTADGHLITEIGGNQIGAVRSQDLCRAFFDMYIGDIPVSQQTKEEIGRNVVNIMRRC